MEKTTWDHICDVLEDLSAEQFKRFTDKLVDSPFEPRTRRKAVEGKDRGDVSRHLLDAYTEKGAVEVTVKTLRAIGFNWAAEDLENHVKSNSTSTTKTPSVTPTALSGAAFIDAKWQELIQRASGLNTILDCLLMKKVLSNEQYCQIRAEATEQQRMRLLLMEAMRASGNTGKNILYDILIEQQPYMMKDLGAH